MKSLLRIFGFSLLMGIYCFFQCVRAINSQDLYSISGENFVRLLLSEFGVFLALLSIVSGAVALLLCSVCARLSHRSQNTLIRLFSFCRHILPFMMVGLILFCGLAFVFLILSELVWLVTNVKMYGESGKVVIFALATIGGTLWMLLKSMVSLRKCFALFSAEASEIEGRSVSKYQAPKLWRWISNLATHGNVVMPDNIVVGFFDCFYVTANKIHLSNGEKLVGNTLYLPLTYASMMSQIEIAAVIGHELGHFSGQDTQYSLRFLPLYAGLENSLDAIANNAQGVSYIDRVVLYPALEIGLWFLRVFHETVRYWSRLRELAADKAGATVASPQSLASALLRISALDSVIQPHLNKLITGKFIDKDFLITLLENAKKQPALDVCSFLEQEIQHPTDSHPTTRVRIDALGVALDENLLNRAARPASEHDYQEMMSMLDKEDVQTIPQMLTESIVAGREEMRAQWEEQAARVHGTVALCARTIDTWLLVTLAIVLWVVGLIVAITNAGTSAIQYVGWFLCALGVMFALLARKHYQDTKQPFYRFTPEGIICPSVEGVFQWEWIEASFTVGEKLGSTCIIIHCHPKLTLPVFKRRMAGLVPERNGTFTMIIPEPLFIDRGNSKEKITVDAAIDLFQQYWLSADARRKLKAL
ncbi:MULTISPECIES: M48 family metallopeptidase [unclassified Pseudocitrobacter]|uniref:M48 family metallopeptidase n=1 Tax=unclassified Pseudocitrobacter TaxID=2638778 RepID=UPI0023E38BA0|nr:MULTISPECIES: M48 family metallopeptidase [unclassified Pseudocitrobacter]MDF3826293.1 M48 family metallopeptidase [Pseudocitrobacter sp. 2023EL-00150]MEC5372112.1 M48 family metallopeptidase [Pseudocitrobacter sp. MW920760]